MDPTHKKGIMAKRTSTHYIDNEKFLEELIAYKKVFKQAKHDGEKPPGVSNYIGQCFLDMATNLAKKPNFANYIFKEEMISDAIENCIMYAKNFDVRKSRNPFAFFTQIIYYAFIRRITKEKKHLYVKMKVIEEADKTGRFRNYLSENNRYSDEEQRSENPFAQFVGLGDRDLKNLPFEKPKAKKRSAKKKKGTHKRPSRKTLDDVME